MTKAPPDPDAEFSQLRDRLFGIGYRMTGSVADAEDLCQEAWLRWQRADRATVSNPEAYLVSVVTRLAIDGFRSARTRREQYVGPYLPEPIIEGDLVGSQPEPTAELADSLTFAFLVMLDELGPQERAVLLLREVFGYDYDEVAQATGKSADACRQILSRTRRKLDTHRVDLQRASSEHEQRMIGDLVVAMMSGDIPGVMALLSPDVVEMDDGGPNRHAGRRPVVGPHRVSRLIVNIAKRVEPNMTFEFVRVNATPGLLIRVDGRPDMVFMVEFAPDGRIRRLFSQLNPDKLTHLT
jgi:RNA polymerase sigma-70 factor (ECF subfamily)